LLRQQPALRVKAIIDKLLYTTGRDQRRALFSLKGLFQEDKDLVHEFVQNGGLQALIQLVGARCYGWGGFWPIFWGIFASGNLIRLKRNAK
jgi:hypothetical protein